MKPLTRLLGALFALWALCAFFDGLFYHIAYSDLMWAFFGWLGVEW